MLLLGLIVGLPVAMAFQAHDSVPTTANPFQLIQMTEETAACEDEDLALDRRIEICSELIEDESLPPEVRPQIQVLTAHLYTQFAEEIRSTGDEYRASSLNMAAIDILNVALTSEHEFSSDQDYLFVAHCLRGMNHRDLERWDAAIADFTRCSESDPDVFEAYYFRGQALANAGRIDEAFADYDQVLAADPPFPVSLRVYLLRVLALCRGDRQHEIEQELTQSEEASSYSTTVYLQLTLSRQGFYSGWPSDQWNEESRAALNRWVAADCPFP